MNDATQQLDSCKYWLFTYQDNSIDLIISRILRDVNIYIFSVLMRGGDSAILIIQ